SHPGMAGGWAQCLGARCRVYAIHRTVCPVGGRCRHDPCACYVVRSRAGGCLEGARFGPAWLSLQSEPQSISPEGVMSDLQQAASPAEPRLSYVMCASKSGMHRMAYWEWGDPDNDQVLLCVHGLTRNG